MPKLLKFCCLRNLMQQFPRQHFCVYRYMHKTSLPNVLASVCVKNYFSTLPSAQANEICTGHLSNEFPDPKKIFSQVLNEAYILRQDLDLKPSILFEHIYSGCANEFSWKVILHMKWPQDFSVEGVAKKKGDAENMAFLNACQQLKKFGMLDKANNPVLPKGEINITDKIVKSAKSDLLNLFQRIWMQHGKKEYIPKFKGIPVEGIYGGFKFWKTELHLAFPENKVFEGSSIRMRDSEGIAAAKALVWLIDKGVINKKHRLIQYTVEEEMKLKKLHSSPYSVCIPQVLQDKMQAVLADLEKQKSLLNVSNCESINERDFQLVCDLLTDKTYKQLTEDERYRRDRKLYEKFKNLESGYDPKLMEIKSSKALLPITQKREDILKLIDENQVVVLSGETGCGKSTQVPQFILDHFISQKKGSECNIVVTQPRRVSAVSIAERVAKERNEKVGDTVGYQIRLSRCLPHGNGGILYCTTGMLFRKLCSNPNLEGISHVIVDEVHERSNHNDFLLILLQKVLNNNKNIKLILMSATFNSQIFSQYFNYCPVINVPGKIYPVQEYFLEDLQNVIPCFETDGKREPVFDVNLMVDVINHIDETQPPGAILCFLPGWPEIRTVHSKLLDNQENISKLFVCPIHSRVQQKEQKNIFIKPDGQRKVILATNIAETSITVDDVVYVVDSGLHKGTSLDTEIGIASLTTQWITKANVRQRRGRAGRVQPGVCYHLYSRKTHMKMEDYPIPEILRMPLEKVILDCKLYCPDMKAEDLLSKAIQSPPAASIQSGVNELQVLGVLDEEENLTDLGKVVVYFATHPRLSIALIYAAFLGCLDPILTICAILTMEKEPFVNTLDDKFEIKRIKQIHDNDLCSDHLALKKIFSIWESLSEETDITQYTEKYLLDEQSLQFIKKLKELFAEDLHMYGVIGDARSYNDYGSAYNVHSHHVPTILAVLTAAFYPNVVKIIQGEINHGRVNKESIIYSLIKGQKAYIQKESVASEEDELPSPWLVYFSALKSEARRLAMMSSVSSVPGICFLLLVGKDITMESVSQENGEENSVTLLIDNYKKLIFSCSEKEARILLDWRECFQDIFKLFVQTLREWPNEKKEYMMLCKNKFLPVMKEILETPQVPFTKGETYVFKDGNLESKEL